MLWAECTSSPKSYVEALTPPCNGVWKGRYWRLGLNEVMGMRSRWDSWPGRESSPEMKLAGTLALTSSLQD